LPQSVEYGDGPAVLDDKAFLTLLYNILLEREPDSGGFADWLGKLGSGELSRHQVALRFIASDEFQRSTELVRNFPDLAVFEVFGTKLLVPRGSDAFDELANLGWSFWTLGPAWATMPYRPQRRSVPPGWFSQSK
jgi:hypothetical protein